MKDIDQLKSRSKKLVTIEPLGRYILVRKDSDKKITSGGILLPDDHEIPVLTGIVLGISAELTEEPINKYDRVIVNPERAVPVDFEDENLYLVPIGSVIGRISSE